MKTHFWAPFLLWLVGLALALASGCTRKEPPKPSETSRPVAEKPSVKLSAQDVLDRTIEAYRKATSYADAGSVHLLAEAGNEKIIDETAPYSMTFERPNKLRVQANQAMQVCDGQKLFAAIEDQPGQVVVRPAPAKVSARTLYADRMLGMALTQGIGGALPQAVLLLTDDPAGILLRDAEPPVLAEPGQIEGRDCHRLQIRRPDGTATFWIDRESYLLRRVVMPTEEIFRAIRQQQPVDRVVLTAELVGARFDKPVDPKAFEYEAPQGAEVVRYFVPPHTAQLLGKKTPEFKFVDLDAKPTTPQSLSGKVAVLEFWATWCGPCKQILPEVDQVRAHFKDNPNVVFFAVSVDQPEIEAKAMTKMFEEMKIGLPILRDVDQSAAALKFTGIPAMMILGADGVVQDFEVGGNPKLAETLTDKIDRLLKGENIYEKPLAEYQEQLKQYEQTLESAAEDAPNGPEPIITQRELPKVETAPKSDPTSLKLAPRWKCDALKQPGNVLAVRDAQGQTRLAVVENWKSVAEVALDGKLIALHKLNLEDHELIGSLRAAAGADGRRWLAAFLTTHQRCHLLDEKWNHVVSYPEDALKHPHSGIADVELGDLDGDGMLEMCVSYWGVVGVQGAALDGRRLWSNRMISNVTGLAIGPADEKSQRGLYCTHNAGSLAVLDAQGQRQREIVVPGRMLHWVVAAELGGPGQLFWTGMTSPALGENLVVGFAPEGKELWTYALPPGVQPQPIEPIIPGRVTRDGPGQWLLPGPDGSIHIVGADGRLVDKFNSGTTLHGLAAVQIDDQPLLILSTAQGLEAWTIQ